MCVQVGQALQHVELRGQTVWTCEACKDGEYSVNAQDPTSGCNACPLGADCKGGQLQGLVPDSLWVKDESEGIMRLVSPSSRTSARRTGLAITHGHVDGGCQVSCPAGYQLINQTTDSSGLTSFSHASQRCARCAVNQVCSSRRGICR